MPRSSTLLIAAGMIPGLLSPLSRADDPKAEGEWIEVGNDEGIRIYRKEIPGDPVFAYKGEGALNAPLGKVITVSQDVARQHEWVNRLESARVIRELGPHHRIVYMKVDSPWPVSDRDFVVESKLTVDRVKKTAVIDFRSVEDPLAPPDDCCVRAQMHRNHIELKPTPDGKTAVIAEAHVDPRGSLPAWIVNKVQKTFPKKSILGLLRQVAKPGIPDFFAQ